VRSYYWLKFRENNAKSKVHLERMARQEPEGHQEETGLQALKVYSDLQVKGVHQAKKDGKDLEVTNNTLF